MNHLFDARSLVPQLGREPLLPEVRGFDDVIVDADDLRQVTHALVLRGEEPVDVGAQLG